MQKRTHGLAQSCPIPIAELEPTRAQEQTARRNLGIEKVWIREGGEMRKVRSPYFAALARDRKYRRHRIRTVRDEFGFAPADVIDLLADPRLESVLEPHEAQNLQALAMGNVSRQELPAKLGLTNDIALLDLVDGWERRIIRKALLLGLPLKPRVPMQRDDFANQLDASEDALAMTIEKTSGGEIGGSVISRSKGANSKQLALDSFERGGRITRESGRFGDGGFSDAPAYDDYSEDSEA